MTRAVLGAANVVTLLAVLSAAAALAVTRDAVASLAVLLDLLLAASLLRLAFNPTPLQVLASALVLLVKQVARLGLRRAAVVRPVR